MKAAIDHHFTEKIEDTAVITTGGFSPYGLPCAADAAGKAENALLAGADMVFRLPVIGVLSGPETCAFATMTMCDRLSMVDELLIPVHGLEKDLLEDLAMFLFKEPPAYQKEVRRRMGDGLSFKEARAESAELFVPGAGPVLLDETDAYAAELKLAAYRRYSGVKFTLIKVPGCAEDREAETADTDRALAGCVAAYLMGKSDAELTEGGRMTPSVPWQVSEQLVKRKEELAGCGSFGQMAEMLSGGKVAPEQVRRGLLMLIIGIRLPNLSIAGLEAFCPYIRVDGAAPSSRARLIGGLDEARLRAISMDGVVLTKEAPDESRTRLSLFDEAAERLWRKVNG